MESTPTKTCWICKTPKALNDFHQDRRQKDGKQKRCKECSKGYSTSYEAKNPGYYKKKGREAYNPEDNPKRYQQYREDYLMRRKKDSTTVRSRLRNLLSSSKDRARRHGLPFELTLEWAMERYEEQKGLCLLTNIPLVCGTNEGNGRLYMPFSPSLDQINAGEGYTFKNSRLVCVAVNIALNRFGEGVLRQVCEGYLAQLTARQARESAPSSSVPPHP